MQLHLARFALWLRTAARQNSDVQAEATTETLRRFRILATFVVPVNLIYVAEFWFHSSGQESARHANWANAIGWIHAVMCVSMVILGLAIHRLYPRLEHNKIFALSLQILFCTSCLMFGVALSVADQMVSSNTTNFAMISLIVAMMSLMRPVMVISVFFATYLIFFNALAITQPDLNLVAMARSHSASATLMSIIASIVVWRQYVASVLLRREITQANETMADQQAELAFMATRDSLTGLYLRREFIRLAKIELARATRFPTDTGILMVDLDFFKRINDTLGHPAGDAVLQQVGALLTKGVRSTDIVARMGGEEFIVLLPNTSRDGSLAVAEKLRALVRERPLEIDGKLIPVTASLGVSGFSRTQQGAIESLYAAADHALYTAKQRGRDRVEFAEPQAIAAPSEFVGQQS